MCRRLQVPVSTPFRLLVLMAGMYETVRLLKELLSVRLQQAATRDSMLFACSYHGAWGLHGQGRYMNAAQMLYMRPPWWQLLSAYALKSAQYAANQMVVVMPSVPAYGPESVSAH